MLKLKIVTEGETFQGADRWSLDLCRTFTSIEVARILRRAAELILDGKREFTLLDIDGNHVGQARLTD